MSIMEEIHQKKIENNGTFNEFLIYGNRSDELIDYINLVFKDYERVGCYKILSSELITDERLIDINKYEMEKFKYKEKLKEHKLDECRSINDSRFNLLKILFEISDGVSVKQKEVALLLPKLYNKYYYMINGKKLYPIYQIVENSTYKTSDDRDILTMKTLRSPIKIMRTYTELEDTNKEIYNTTTYTYIITFGRNVVKINPLLYYFAKDGFINGLHYLDVGDFIRIRSYDLDYENEESKKYICFKLSSTMYCHVHRERFLEDPYLQSIIIMLTDIIINKDGDDILDKNYWIRRLGKAFNNTPNELQQYNRGINSLNSFEISLDFITQSTLKLEDADKMDAYALLRWLLQNYDDLFNKDNHDLKNKRIRICEYIAAELVMIISAKLYNLLKSSKIEMKDLENALVIKPNILIYKMQESPLLRYDNAVNDLTVFASLKYTTKGISTMGDKNAERMPIEYRFIDVSHVGKIDINTSSNGDPGVTGNLCPMSDMKTCYFDDAPEPSNYRPDLYDEIDNIDYENLFKSDFVVDLKECFINKKEIIATLLNLKLEREILTKSIINSIINDTKNLAVRKTKHNTIEEFEKINPLVDLKISPQTLEKSKVKDIIITLLQRKR